MKFQIILAAIIGATQAVKITQQGIDTGPAIPMCTGRPGLEYGSSSCATAEWVNTPNKNAHGWGMSHTWSINWVMHNPSKDNASEAKK